MNVDIQEITAEVDDIVDREKRKPSNQAKGVSAEQMTQMMRRAADRAQWTSERLQS